MNSRLAPFSGTLVACLLTAVPSLAESVPAASSAAASGDSSAGDAALAEYSRARSLYRTASEEFARGHYTKARELLLEAWNLRHSYDVAASLGDTEVRLGLFAEAAEHLSFSLRTFPPLENEQALANVRRQFEVARGMTAAFRVTVDEPEADVRVDGRLVGVSPLAGPLFVVPGRHTLEARKGSAIGTQTVIGEAATETVVSLRLAAPPPGLPPPPTQDRGRRSVMPLIAGGAVVAVGLTAGIAFRLSADADDEDANAIRARLGASDCYGAGGQSADCVALRGHIDGANRSTALATTGFVLAGAGLVAAPLWYLLSPRRRQENPVAVSAFVAPGVGAVSASGRF